MNKILLGLCLTFAPFINDESASEVSEPATEQVEEVSSEVVQAPEENEVTGEVEKPTDEITYPCNIKYGNLTGGDAICDVDGGEIGTVVTMTVKAYFLYTLNEVTVNGVVITPNEEGQYQFALAEGDNVIDATFVIDEEELAYIASLINQAEKGGWTSLFTLNNLKDLLVYILGLFMTSGFFVTLLKVKKTSAKTKTDTTAEAAAAIKETAGNTINSYLENVTGPIMEKILERLNTSDTTMKTMVRCMMLMQEDTPESRLAIMQELTNLNNANDNELAKQIKKMIESEIAKNDAEKKAADDALAQLEAANENLLNIATGTTTDSDNSDSEGRY